MYNPKSCNALEKPFYTPVEAALRWCNLIAHEIDILNAVGVDPVPAPAAFPQWPCLRANAEKILDAILNKELPYGRDGRPVSPGEQVARHRLTIRHTDLKAWMARHYPDQKPPFLFDEIERTTHAAITVEALQALQAERDALKARLAKAEDWWELEGKGLKAERDEWRAKCEQAEAEAKPSHLLALAVLIEILQEPRNSARNQSGIIGEILERYPSRRGLSQRNLEDIFSTANKTLSEKA